MAGKNRLRAILFAVSACCEAHVFAQATRIVPTTKVNNLNGQPVLLPGGLPARATVLILGFGRHSQDATTAWERPTRSQLAKPGWIGFYDMAMLAEVPGLVRPFVLRAVKHEVPDVLKPNFLPLTDDEDAWKRAAGYAQDQPEAAYVMLVDRSGRVQWSTHAGYSPSAFAELRQKAEDLARITP